MEPHIPEAAPLKGFWALLCMRLGSKAGIPITGHSEPGGAPQHPWQLPGGGVGRTLQAAWEQAWVLL